MTPINIVVEDNLSEAMLRTILNQSGENFVVARRYPDLKRTHSSSGFGYIKTKIEGFNKAARGTPFLVLTDLDNYECAPSLINHWLPGPRHPNLIFRVAKREVESWVIADRNSFARFLGIRVEKIPFDIDSIPDPKNFIINLTRSSKYGDIKHAIVPRPGSVSPIGPGYNGELISFVQNKWELKTAVNHSDSLNRAVKAVYNFNPV